MNLHPGFSISLILCIVFQGVVGKPRPAPQTKCKGVGTFVARNGDCDKYVRCIKEDGERVGWICPEDELFDPFRHRCVAAQKAISCRVCFGNNGQRIKLKKSEGTFFECVDNTPQKMQCKSTSVFDTGKMKCIKNPKGGGGGVSVNVKKPKKDEQSEYKLVSITADGFDITAESTGMVTNIKGKPKEKPGKAKPAEKPGNIKAPEQPGVQAVQDIGDVGSITKNIVEKDNNEEVEVLEEEIIPDDAVDPSNTSAGFNW